MCKEELLRRGVLVDPQDESWLDQNICITGDNRVIVYTLTNGILEQVSLSRLILGAPPCLKVDHINGNVLDNRRSNLRLATHSQNLANSKLRVDNRVGYKGVRYSPKHKFHPWVARTTKDGKTYQSCHKTKEEAALAYNKMATELFGEFARLNTICDSL